MTLESCSARTLSLLLNCASLSASLTMTGAPGLEDLAHDAVADGARGVGDGVAVDVARRPDAGAAGAGPSRPRQASQPAWARS